MDDKPKKITAKTSKRRKNGANEEQESLQVIFLRKSNRIIEAWYYLPLWELRLFQELIERIKPNEEQGTDFVFINLREFAERFNSVSGYTFHAIREASLKLATRAVAVRTEDETGIRRKNFPLLSEANAPDELFPNGDRNSYVVLHLNPRLRSEFIELTQSYTQYNPEMTRKLSSVYSIRIYEILARYRFLGQAKLDLEEFRQMVGALVYDHDSKKKKVLRNRSSTFGVFNRDILIPAKNSIEAVTDLRFEFKPIYDRTPGKAGRRTVTGVHLYNIRYSLEAEKKYGKKGSPEPIPPDILDTDFEVVGNAASGDATEEDQAVIQPANVDLFGNPLKRTKAPTGKSSRQAVLPGAMPPGSPNPGWERILESGKQVGLTDFLLRTSLLNYSAEKVEIVITIIENKLAKPGAQPIENVNGYFSKLLREPDLENQFSLQQMRLKQQALDQEKQRSTAQRRDQLKKELSHLKNVLEDQNRKLNHEQDRVIRQLFAEDYEFHITVHSRVNAVPEANAAIQRLEASGIAAHEVFTRSSVFHYFYLEARQLWPEYTGFSTVIEIEDALSRINSRIQEIETEIGM